MSSLSEMEWQDMTNGKEGVTMLQFADRFSRVLFLTAMQYEKDDEDDEELDGSGDICETLTAIAMAVGQTVETFGPFEKDG